jgi:hypothetical protein
MSHNISTPFLTEVVEGKPLILSTSGAADIPFSAFVSSLVFRPPTQRSKGDSDDLFSLIVQVSQGSNSTVHTFEMGGQRTVRTSLVLSSDSTVRSVALKRFRPAAGGDAEEDKKGGKTASKPSISEDEAALAKVQLIGMQITTLSAGQVDMIRQTAKQ